jgi:hypothetical protein
MRQITLRGGRDSVQRTISVELQRPDTRSWIEGPINRFGRSQSHWQVDSVGYQRMNVHVVLPASSHLDYTHLHPGEIEQRGNQHAGVNCAPRVLYPSQSVQTAKERHLNRAAPIYEGFQVVSLAMYPEVRIRRVQISEKGQPRLQPIWVETRRREEVKVYRHPMAEL